MDIDGKPVNRLAAYGMVGDRFHSHVYTDAEEKQLRRQAKKLRDETGQRYTECLNAIAKNLGFRDWRHFSEFKKLPGTAWDYRLPID